MLLLDESLNRFRLAGRELFNQHFRVADPYDNEGWMSEQRFAVVEAELFRQLVAVPHAIAAEAYGTPQPGIQVALRQGRLAPALLNRAIDSGDWDHPIHAVAKETVLSFVRFFDWDLLDVRDHQYVWARIDAWPAHPELAGKHALVEWQYVLFRETLPLR